MNIKSVLKDMLPESLVQYASAVKEQMKLAAIDPQEFLPESLRTSNDFYIDMILENEDAASTWDEDHADLSRLYPSAEIEGGLNPGDRRALYTLVRALKPASVLEIGTHVGTSTLHIARALKSNGGGHLTTIDMYDVNHVAEGSWKRHGLPFSVRQMLEQAGLEDRVTFQTDDALNYLKTTDLSFDMIFLDGDHSAIAVYHEVSAALKRLSTDGIIILHDYFPDGKALFTNEEPDFGPYLGLRRITAENPKVVVQPLGNLPWETRENSRTTTLAVILQG